MSTPVKARQPLVAIAVQWQGQAGYLHVSEEYSFVQFQRGLGIVREVELSYIVGRLLELAPRVPLLQEAAVHCITCGEWHPVVKGCAAVAPQRPSRRSKPVVVRESMVPFSPPRRVVEIDAGPAAPPLPEEAPPPAAPAPPEPQHLRLVQPPPEPKPPTPPPAKPFRNGRPPTRPFAHLKVDSPERHKANLDAGTCPKCEVRPLAPERRRCAECLQAARAAKAPVSPGPTAPPPPEAAPPQQLPECIECYRAATHGTRCEHHAKKNREKARRHRLRQGLAVDVAKCRNCGEAGHNVISCPQPPREGRCQKCSEPATHGKLCLAHRLQAREKVNASHARLHPDAKPRPCGVCGQIGHNGRSCPQRGMVPSAPEVAPAAAGPTAKFIVRPDGSIECQSAADALALAKLIRENKGL